MVYSPFSPNDGTPTAITTAAEQASLDDVIAAIRGYANKTALWTPCPNTSLSWDATADGSRLAFRDAIKAYAPGIPVADFEPILSDGETPARYATGLSSDGLHPNETGAGNCVPVLQPLLQGLL